MSGGAPGIRAMLVAAVLCIARAGAQDGGTPPPWEAVSGRHFVVHHRGTPVFAEQVRQRAEAEYDRITRELGFVRHGGFWLWDRRARIYLYPSEEAFRRDTGAPSWAVGKADHRARSISGFVGHPDFLGGFLRHELGHLVFREFVGFEGDVPLWLDEGVSLWLEGGGRDERRAAARRQAAAGRAFTVRGLTSVSPAVLRDAGFVPEFYAQAGALVDFLVARHGSGRFLRFCRQLRDGKPMDDALRFAYGGLLGSMDAWEAAWAGYLGEPLP